MKAEDKKRIITFYESRYEQFGYDVRSAGWGDIESQRLRFNILADIADLSGCSVCDLGCGCGDLYPYLLERFGDVNYLGIDLSEKLISEAKKRHPGAAFTVNNILENPPKSKVDYVLSSGTLTFKVEKHKNYLRRMLEAMMAMSNKGVAVNFLSSYVDYKLEKNFHFSPEEAFTLGRELTRFLTIRHDYPLYEFTMYLYHSGV